ncbi:MAG: carboxypeptidase regulatory-like domain-containing protein, partial [Planctomycetota bacterium]
MESIPGALVSPARRVLPLLLAVLLFFVPTGKAQIGVTPGTIRGVVTDADFDAPLPGVRVEIFQTSQATQTTDRGNYVISQVPPGQYTVIFSRPNFRDLIRNDVIVEPGRVTDLSVLLFGEYTELREFVVKDVVGGGTGTEQAVLDLRFEATALLDSISAEFISRAGASDAAAALNLVAGATVQDGRFAVIRGLPNRFVSSQLNGVRLPTTVDDERAVELDQFPSNVIESIQVSKTFTPDQQADATGGAVDVRLKSIPDSTIRNLKVSTGFNSNVAFDDDFLTFEDGGVGAFGVDEGPNLQPAGTPWDGSYVPGAEDTP